MKTACIVLNYNDSEHVVCLVDKIKCYSVFDFVIIVDNNSIDNSYDILSQKYSDLIVLKAEQNGGYGYGNNIGLKYAFDVLQCDHAVVSNPDVFFDEKLIFRMINIIKSNTKIGIISAVQKDISNNIVVRSAWKLPSKKQYISSYKLFKGNGKRSIFYDKDELFYDSIKEVGCVAGSLICFSKNAFRLTGGFDENIFLYCEETALGFRAKNAELKTVIITDETYSHLHGASINKAFSSIFKRQRLLNKSHHYVLKTYLRPNVFNLFFDNLICCSKLILLILSKPFRK